MPHMSVLFASDSSRTMYVVLVYIVHIETEHLYCQNSTVHQTVVVCGCYFRGHLWAGPSPFKKQVCIGSGGPSPAVKQVCIPSILTRSICSAPSSLRSEQFSFTFNLQTSKYQLEEQILLPHETHQSTEIHLTQLHTKDATFRKPRTPEPSWTTRPPRKGWKRGWSGVCGELERRKKRETFLFTGNIFSLLF